MFLPRHIRKLIISFKPPWWVDEDIKDLLEKEEIELVCEDYAEYLDFKFPMEAWLDDVDIERVCQDHDDYVQNIYNCMKYAEYFG